MSDQYFGEEMGISEVEGGKTYDEATVVKLLVEYDELRRRMSVEARDAARDKAGLDTERYHQELYERMLAAMGKPELVNIYMTRLGLGEVYRGMVASAEKVEVGMKSVGGKYYQEDSLLLTSTAAVEEGVVVRVWSDAFKLPEYEGDSQKLMEGQMVVIERARVSFYVKL